MGVYAYCVVPAGHEPPSELRGVAGERVETLAAGPLMLWVSRMVRPEGSVEQIKAHNAVVEAAVTEAVTPVPLRFGQWVEEETDLVRPIAESAAAYEEKLREFAGCLEFGIRVIDPGAPHEAQDVRAVKAASGRGYMQALQESTRLAEQRRVATEAVRNTIQEKVSDLVRAEREEESQTPHAVVTVSHLVPRANFNEYRERARQIRAVYPALRLLLSGPWPPYSFAA